MKIQLKHIVLSSLSVLITCVGYGQTNVPFISIDYQAEYIVNKGRLSGAYSSKYSNGNSKATGQLINGFKYGEWKLYDSTGTLVLHRLYNAPFQFRQIFPEQAEAEPAYNLQYNDAGYIPYFEFEQKNIKWSKRVWRNIEETDNEELFKKDRLFKLFCDLADKNSIQLYSAQNDEFTDELEYKQEKFKSISPIRCQIKEDVFFDTDRMEMETRIIGICPVAAINGKDQELFWVYLSDIREHLAKHDIKSDFWERIKTFDDLFFFRDFASSIYKESNHNGKPIEAYKQSDEIALEAERIEMAIINKEIDLLLSLAR
ncbi:MAG: hypothetical protein CL842_11260 [Crocinitomicaceae bacterium]|nr:hypothetical protein [Crocinitomicaceae bacterium]|tara:strand:+ start:77325 stop:78269 length:945 start_codon:yes stop_codon:yes gene_type:complete